ncbi:Trypsin-like peptidase domain protein [anaerobic digester metagenome]
MLLSGLESCSLIFYNRKTTITASTPGSEIYYLNGGQKYKKLDTAANTIKVSKINWLLIKNSKPGYQTETYMIRDSAFNPKKIIDLGLSLACFVSGAMLMEVFYDYDPIENPAYFLLASGFVNLVFGHFTHYPGKIKLPELKPIPRRNGSGRFLVIDELKVNLPPDSICEREYQNLRFYSLNAARIKRFGKKSVFYNDQFLLADLNKMLAATDFTDTTNSLIQNTYNSVRINAEITSITFHTVIRTQNSITMGIRFSLHELNSKKELYSRYIKAKSQIFLPDQVNTDKEIISSTLENALFEFLSDSAIIPFLRSREDEIQARIDSLPDIVLNNENHPTDYTGAMHSVVTIQRGEIIGSGCIVSSDGYIITTKGVTNDNAEELSVIFGNAVRKKCSIIRVNEKFDLVLLKVDTTGLTPLRINTSKKIEVGDETFAVGTPEYDALNQSLSKGIISGKRKSNNVSYIQTDVSINKGCNGGALLNAKGELIGIINERLFSTEYEGIGFAIPAYYLYEALKIKGVK